MSERDEQISFLLKLQIDQLEASDLFNTGSRWDKQDPSVTIVIGPKKFQTAREFDVGVNAKFQETFEYITRWDSKMTFDVGVWNVSSSGDIKAQIGNGSITIDIDNIYNNKNGTELQKVQLVHIKSNKKEIKQGTVSFRLQTIPVDEAGLPIRTPVQAKEPVVPHQLDTIDPMSRNHLLFQIDNLRVSDLFDTGTFLDPQDPSLTITLGNKSFKTARQCDAKTKASFPEKFEYITEWVPSMVRDVVLVEVSNEEKGGKIKYKLGQGTATIDIESILVGNNGGQIVLDIPLVYNESLSKGRVSLLLQVFLVDETGKRQQLLPAAQEQVQKVSVESRDNILCEIDNLRASDLFDTGTDSDHQDPSLTITLDGRSFQTARIKDAGVEASFDESFQFITTWVPTMVLDVEVWNQSIYGVKKHVGKGRTTMTVDNIIKNGGVVALDIPLIHTFLDGTIENKGFVSLDIRFSSKSVGIETQQLVSQKGSNNSYQPYSISVSVISASNLPVSDFQTSDPYVIVYCGDNHVGKTKTINGNLNPVWGHNGQGEEFNFDSLHINKMLMFSIYDSNTSRSHVLLGVVKIPLNEVPRPSHGNKYLIAVAERFQGTLKDPSELVVSIAVKKNDSLVRIIPDHTSTTASMDYLDLINSETGLLSKPVGEAVTATLRDFVTVDTELFIDEDLLRDLFRDLRSITDVVDTQSSPTPSSSASFSSWDGLHLFRRTSLNIFNGRKINLVSLKESYYSPIERNSLQINLSADCKRFVVLQLTNRFSMWTWAKWLLMLDGVWRNGSALPDWANVDEFHGQITVHSSNGRDVTGMGYVTYKKPFQLKVNADNFDLSSMVNIILSADSERPKSYVLDGELLSYQGDFESRSTESTPQHRESIFGKMKDVVKDTISAVSLGGDGASTGKDLSKPAAVLSTPQKRVSIPGQSKNSFVSLHFEHSRRSLSARQPLVNTTVGCIERFYFDIENTPTSKLLNPRSKHRPDSISSSTGIDEGPSLPGFIDSSPNLYLYLLSGKEGTEKMCGQQCISIPKLLRNRQQLNPLNTFTDPAKSSSFDRFCDSNTYEFSLDLNSDDSFGFSLTLLEVQNLKLPSQPSSSFSLASVTHLDKFLGSSLQVTVRLADTNGISLAGGGKAIAMPPLAATASKIFQWSANNSAVFYPRDGISNNSFVIVEIALSSNMIGSAFVPLHYFQLKEQELFFPVVSSNKFFDVGSIGYVKAVIKIVEKVNPEVTASLQLRTVLRESSIFNSTWYAECLLQGAIATTDPSNEVEKFVVYPAMEGLLLFNNSDHDHEDIRDTTATTSKFDLSSMFTLESNLDYHLEVKGTINTQHHQSPILLEVFENQRRYPPSLRWTHYTITQPNFSDEELLCSYNQPLKFAKAPKGLKWSGDWVMDRDYAATDSKGWSYGPSLHGILKNCREGKSDTVSANALARRRKWVREAIVSSSSDSSDFSSASKEDHGVGGAARTNPNWRLAAYRSGCKAPLALCKERLAPELPVVVSWDQVLSVSKITSSLLWIEIKVNRCFIEDAHHTVKFQSAVLAVFVSNCPAAELQALIEERKWFHKIRTDIQHVAESRSMMVFAQRPHRLSTLDGDIDDERNTEVIPLGSQIIADLDYASLDIESTMKDLKERDKQRNDKSVKAELSVLVRRNLRIRLYMAALLGIGLKGDHNFLETEIKNLLEEDFRKCRMIEKDGDVATANNRIEFLLDMAEQRLRDTALCGWAYKGGVLERSLEVLVNEYFIEIINQLGELFENKRLQTIRGFTSRDGLISMYMTHNDRLKVVLTRSLRAYFLRPSPDPTLSLFLSFDKLLHWYSTAQLTDMKTFVRNTISTYGNEQHTGQRNPLPWMPCDNYNAPAHTDFCRELVSILSIPLMEQKKLSIDTISESFSSRIKEYGSTLSLQYISSFTFLASLYSDALDLTNSRISSEAAEFEDHMSFLYSVANDAVYAQSSSIFPHEVIDITDYALEVKGMRANFARVQSAALEQLLSVFIKYLYFDSGESQRMQVSLSTLATATTEPHIPCFLEKTTEYLQGNRNALETDNFVMFCAMVVEVWIQYIFWLIVSLWNPSSKFSFHDNKEALKRLHLDIDSVNKLASRVSVGERVCAVLNSAYSLLAEPEDSAALSLALERLTIIARAEPCRAESIANLIDVCRDLRCPAHCRPRFAAAVPSEVEHIRSSFVGHVGHAIARLVPSHHHPVKEAEAPAHECLALQCAAVVIREEASSHAAQQVHNSPRVMHPEMIVFRSLTAAAAASGGAPSMDDILANSMPTPCSTGQVDSTHAEDSYHAATAARSLYSLSPASPAYTVKISKLQVHNIFRFRRLTKFSSCLQVDCCGQLKRTSVKPGYSPSWINNEPIELPVSFGNNQDVNLRIALMDSGLWGSTSEIGHITVILFQRSQGLIEQQQQPFELAEGDAAITEAAKVATNELVPFPSLSFTVELCCRQP